MKILILGAMFLFSAATFASDSCTCHFAGKDYDPAKGFYFDKVTWEPLPKISYRMGCNYTCTDKKNNTWKVTYIHNESHFGKHVGGPSSAKKFICDLSIKNFIPHYDMPDHINYYEPELQGEFASKYMNHRPEFKYWNEKYCN